MITVGTTELKQKKADGVDFEDLHQLTVTWVNAFRTSLYLNSRAMASLLQRFAHRDLAAKTHPASTDAQTRKFPAGLITSGSHPRCEQGLFELGTFVSTTCVARRKLRFANEPHFGYPEAQM